MRRPPVLRLTSVLGPVLGVVLVLGGCGSPSEPAGESDPAGSPTRVAPTTSTATTTTPGTGPTLTPGEGKTIRLSMTGTLEDGVESGCLVFTDEATGETYSVIAEQLPETTLDGRVTVAGAVDPDMMSFCMQGPILIVDEVTEPAG